MKRFKRLMLFNWIMAMALIVSSIANGFIHYQRNKDFVELLEINKRFVKTVLEMRECGYETVEPKEPEKEVVWR